MNCAGCGAAMEQAERGLARFWYCDACGAHALTVPILRRILPAELWREVWPIIRDTDTTGPRSCSSCARPMELTAPIEPTGGVRLDVCDPCGLLFLDANELARMPKGPIEEREKLPPEVAKALATAIALEYEYEEKAILAPIQNLGAAVIWGVLLGVTSRR